jgi:hypothetical protein
MRSLEAVGHDLLRDRLPWGEWPPRLPPGITQEVAPNESQRGPRPTAREALIYDVLFVARRLER